MKNTINDNVYKYLSTLKLPKFTRLIVTNLDKTLFDSERTKKSTIHSGYSNIYYLISIQT